MSPLAIFEQSSFLRSPPGDVMRDLHTFSVKNQILNMFAFADHTVSQ